MQVTFNSSLSSAKEFAKLMKFATIREYSKYVNENSLPFKANPSEYKGYVSAADFLGMSTSDYMASKGIAQVINRDQAEINRKLSLTWAKKRADKRAKVNTLQTQLPLTTQVIKPPVTLGLDPDKVISFLIDENLTNYKEIYDWIKSNIETDQPITNHVRDLTLTIMSSSNNVAKHIRFIDAQPTSISSLPFEITTVDAEYLTAVVSFQYSYYEFV